MPAGGAPRGSGGWCDWRGGAGVIGACPAGLGGAGIGAGRASGEPAGTSAAQASCTYRWNAASSRSWGRIRPRSIQLPATPAWAAATRAVSSLPTSVSNAIIDSIQSSSASAPK